MKHSTDGASSVPIAEPPTVIDSGVPGITDEDEDEFNFWSAPPTVIDSGVPGITDSNEANDLSPTTESDDNSDDSATSGIVEDLIVITKDAAAEAPAPEACPRGPWNAYARPQGARQQLLRRPLVRGSVDPCIDGMKHSTDGASSVPIAEPPTVIDSGVPGITDEDEDEFNFWSAPPTVIDSGSEAPLDPACAAETTESDDDESSSNASTTSHFDEAAREMLKELDEMSDSDGEGEDSTAPTSSCTVVPMSAVLSPPSAPASVGPDTVQPTGSPLRHSMIDKSSTSKVADTSAATATFDIDDYSITKCLGFGTYGVVRLAKGPNGTFYAIKTVAASNEAEKAETQRELGNLELLRGLSTIAQLHGVATHGGKVHLLLELGTGGSLWSRVEKGHLEGIGIGQGYKRVDGLHRHEVKYYAAWIVKCITDMHSRNLINRDFKLDNTVLTPDG